MILGVDYYPEQWPADWLDRDLERIVALGANTIRIGEFGWHIVEPEEDRFDFSFFDHVIERAREKGLKIIYGTPTAAPPAWLVRRWPETLSQFENGVPRAYGGRHVCCMSSAVYRERCRKVVTALARHYRDEPAIIAWQIDNELGHEGSDVCWCPQCREAFQRFLEKRFGGDIRQLNETFGTVFWSQQYNDFSEIGLPLPTITTHNPALRLEWERFCSEKIVAFAEEQAQILRREIPGVTVMHDFPGGGLGKHADYSRVAKQLDRVAYNNYPVWGGQEKPLPPGEIAFGLDYIRGLRGENFWVTEAIMGAQGHDVTGFLPRPGQAEMWSWQAALRGCEGLLYFRYRGAAKGAEQFCYGLLDPEDVPGRRYFEAQKFFREVRCREDLLTGPVQADAAILYDFDSLASFRIQRQSAVMDCEQEMKKLHGALFRAGQMVDVIPARRDFSKYSLVLVPSMIVSDPGFARRLKEFAAGGGIVAVTCRTSVKDRDNNLVPGRALPVDLDDLLGVRVCETESVQQRDCFVLEGEFSARAGAFRDMLQPRPGVRTVLRYSDPFYRQYSAVTCNDYGKGKAWYIGACLEPEGLAQVMDEIMKQAGLTPLALPDGVETVVRQGKDGPVRFVINHNEFPCEVFGETLEPFQTVALNGGAVL